MVMRDIAAYYKQRSIPKLRTMKILSDGCRGQYKGKCNFRLLGTFHLQSQALDAQRAALDADRRTAEAVAKQEQKEYRTKMSSIANVAKFLSKEEIIQRGRSNEFFVRVPELPKHLLEDHRSALIAGVARAEIPLGVFQSHDFPQSHHYGGPHYNAGKAPRTLMRRAEAFETARITDYHACYEFCIKHMPRYSTCTYLHV